ncbi:hypothetical protein Shyhy02_51710 [Streptomyces hygroscopicus subsp. hygroscopicus]|nr:hypothetical protein Shyhy02_51710 [Streptomyces hygroscopicus subsp. hygroscopicus]
MFRRRLGGHTGSPPGRDGSSSAAVATSGPAVPGGREREEAVVLIDGVAAICAPSWEPTNGQLIYQPAR